MTGARTSIVWDYAPAPESADHVRLRESYSGYLGHYHVTNQKWDPGPFDFKRLFAKLSGHRAFPMCHRFAPSIGCR